MFQQAVKFVFNPTMHRIERQIAAGITRGALAVVATALTLGIAKDTVNWTKTKFQNRKNSDSRQSVHTATQEVQPTA